MKIDVPQELEKIYEKWGDGPTAEEYYEAVRKYFESKECGVKRNYEISETYGKGEGYVD
jgi:hypothetical protein